MIKNGRFIEVFYLKLFLIRGVPRSITVWVAAKEKDKHQGSKSEPILGFHKERTLSPCIRGCYPDTGWLDAREKLGQHTGAPKIWQDYAEIISEKHVGRGDINPHNSFQMKECDPFCNIYNPLQMGIVWNVVDADARKVTTKVSVGKIIKTESFLTRV
jgi:hypothetical protein